MGILVNDAHCHLFTEGFFGALGKQRGGETAEAVVDRLGWTWPGSGRELADTWVEELDSHGVHRAALIGSLPDEEFAVCEAVGSRPGRFVGFSMFDAGSPDVLRKVNHAFDELSLSCVCLFPAMHRFRLDSREVLEVFEAASRHPGTAVFVHCGVLSVGVRARLGLASRFDIRLGNPLDLQEAASCFPDVPILIPHFGAGFLREALMLGGLHPNVYLDTSSSNSWIRFFPALHLPDVFRQAVDVVGVERIIFGSDSSFFPRGWHKPVFDAQLEIVRSMDQNGDMERRIFYENFETLFPG